MEAYMIVKIQVLMQVYNNTQSYIQVCIDSSEMAVSRVSLLAKLYLRVFTNVNNNKNQFF